MNTLADRFRFVVEEYADRPALVDRGSVTTYRALGERVAARAKRLRALGVSPGGRVALFLPNGEEFVVTYFALVVLGAVVVPLNDQYQLDDLLYFLEASDVATVVSTRAFGEVCERVGAHYPKACRFYYVEEEPGRERSRAALDEISAPIDPNDPVLFQYSSGSTGRPKRIARAHHNLLFELESLRVTLGLTPEDRFIGLAPFSHVNGLMRSMLASMSVGAALYPLPAFKRQAVADLVERERLTVFIAVPFMFSALAEAGFRRAPDFSSLRLCVSSSAPMPVKSNARFHQRYGKYIRQLYGSTETGSISVNLSEPLERSLDSVGRPLAGVEVGVFTEAGSPAAPDEPGELAVRSPGVIAGYDGQEEANREAFRSGYFFTGDIGRRSNEGLLYLVGRKKFFINKGGYKIDPGQIEELLEEHPQVKEAVVLGLPTAYGDERIKAVIVPEGGCSEEAIIAHCRGRIADFKIPSLVEFRESLPRSPTGKIRRQMLVDEA